jgi:hypothetical protein
MNNGNPTGEVRPMIDRQPPNAAETRGASVRTRFCETSGAGSGPRSLAHRSGTAHCRLSEAGNWGISVNDARANSWTALHLTIFRSTRPPERCPGIQDPLG